MYIFAPFFDTKDCATKMSSSDLPNSQKKDEGLGSFCLASRVAE